MTDKVNLTVFCKFIDCPFQIDWRETTKKEALKFFRDFNEKHYESMQCIHDYGITIKEIDN